MPPATPSSARSSRWWKGDDAMRSGYSVAIGSAFAIGLIALGTAPLIMATSQPDRTAPKTGPRTVGLLCIYGIAAGQAEVERRCRPGRFPIFQAEMERAVTLIEDRIISSGATSHAGLERFRREQSLIDDETPELCSAELLARNRDLSPTEIAQYRQEVYQALAQPGPIEFGDCI